MINWTLMVRNRLRLTQQAIESLFAGDDLDQLTITIIDDQSDAPTRDYLESLRSDKIHIIRNEESPGVGESRNRLIRESEAHFGRGDYLYLSENDVYFTPGWLSKLVRAYEMVWPKGFLQCAGYNHPYHQPITQIIDDGSVVNEVLSLQCQATMMKWEVWDKYGPYIQTPVGKVCQSEDVDMSNHIRADGFRLGVIHPHVVINTAITNTFGERPPGWDLIQKAVPEGVYYE